MGGPWCNLCWWEGETKLGILNSQDAMAVSLMGLTSEANTGVYTCLLKEFEFIPWPKWDPRIGWHTSALWKKGICWLFFPTITLKLNLQLIPWYTVCKTYEKEYPYLKRTKLRLDIWRKMLLICHSKIKPVQQNITKSNLNLTFSPEPDYIMRAETLRIFLRLLRDGESVKFSRIVPVFFGKP